MIKMITEARKKANQKYNEKAYDQIKVLVKKGQRDIIKAYAESQGKSLNAYINELISEDMKKQTIVQNNEKSGDQSEDKGLK